MDHAANMQSASNMAKQVRWRVPFASVNGTQYEVEIYDENWTGSPVVLTAGATPFVTDEDASDDFFAPVRSQTGTLQVCTLLPDGTMLRLEDILPDNNIARPVQLRCVDDDVVEWQGFLSCEAYTQDYVGIPQVLDLSLISVLEAMDSVQLNQEYSSGLKRVHEVVYHAVTQISRDCNMTIISHVNYSAECWAIFQKHIDQTVFYDCKEYHHENSTTHIISGMSTKEVLTRLCTYMGWCCREQGTEIYFTRIGGSMGLYREELRYLSSPNYFHRYNDYTPKTVSNIADMTWMGTGHKREVVQGAKSVEVVANIEDYDLDISIPEFPAGNTQTVYRQLWKYKEDGDWLYLVVSKNISAYSNVQFGYYSAELRFMFYNFQNYGTSTLTNVLNYMAVGLRSSAKTALQGDQLGFYTWHAGAFLARYCWEKTGDVAAHEVNDVLYCAFFPNSIGSASGIGAYEGNFDQSQVGPIFSIDNVTNYRCNQGWLLLSATADTIYKSNSNDYTGAEFNHSAERGWEWFIGLELQFGDKWWNGSKWQTSQCVFNARMTKGGFKSNWAESMQITQVEGLLIPITGELQGLITLKIWPMASSASSDNYGGPFEMMFSQLSVEHVVPMDATKTDRSSNHYFRLLGVNFRDEVSVDTNLASYLNNEPSPSLIMNNATQPMTTLVYDVEDGPQESRRPEVDLLNRLAEYYSTSRHRLNLEVAHPTAAPLPLLRLNGINDGKVYAPMAESRDWQMETSTITCMEVPK